MLKLLTLAEQGLLPEPQELRESRVAGDGSLHCATATKKCATPTPADFASASGRS